MALVRTDYGLIYNTDGSLCATLLPEGGVAVTEGTTNLIPVEKLRFEGWSKDSGVTVTLTQNISVPEWKTTKATRIQTTGGVNRYKYWIAISGSETTKTAQVKVKNIGTNTVFLSDGTDIRESVLPGETKYVSYQMTATSINIEFRTDSAEKSLDFIAYQPMVEEKNFYTPFVDGTRPAGNLSYHDLAKQFNQREFTFVAEWRPYTELGIGSSILDRYFQIDNGTTTAGNRIRLSRINNSPGLMLELPNADGSGSQQYSFYPNSYPANAWHFIACVLDVPNMKARIHLNDEYQEFPLTEVPAMLDLQRFFLGCVGTSGQLNGDLRNVRICPYAVSPETVATWHSLDAPFFDPREQIDAGARTIYAPGVQIDETGAWGVANGVKQAGFGTAGKLLWGGGNGEGDADGLHFYTTSGGIRKKTFDITNTGKLVAADGYVIIDSEGKVNGRIIKSGYISVFGATIPLGDYTVPEGKKLISYPIMLGRLGWRLPGSNKNKTLKYIDAINLGNDCSYRWDGGSAMTPVLPPGTYKNLRVNIGAMSAIMYGYTDGTEEEETYINSCYYEIKEVFD